MRCLELLVNWHHHDYLGIFPTAACDRPVSRSAPPGPRRRDARSGSPLVLGDLEPADALARPPPSEARRCATARAAGDFLLPDRAVVLRDPVPPPARAVEPAAKWAPATV